MTSSQPFNGIKSNTYVDTNTSWLELIDGGLNLENIPLGPLLVNSRDVDFIVAVDGRWVGGCPTRVLQFS